uniref:Uncharacterized protein n=1 Tax=Arundo donax TaxID=35708 RepID=A0A0A8ZBR0_ARUDO
MLPFLIIMLRQNSQVSLLLRPKEKKSSLLVVQVFFSYSKNKMRYICFHIIQRVREVCFLLLAS